MTLSRTFVAFFSLAIALHASTFFEHLPALNCALVCIDVTCKEKREAEGKREERFGGEHLCLWRDLFFFPSPKPSLGGQNFRRRCAVGIPLSIAPFRAPATRVARCFYPAARGLTKRVDHRVHDGRRASVSHVDLGERERRRGRGRDERRETRREIKELFFALFFFFFFFDPLFFFFDSPSLDLFFFLFFLFYNREKR